ncbi:preprotein translocase subunit SecA [Neptuniibacter caesariensis]|uniref:Protein translocase subunit SecA n=1 Tax=Neptuniibacter caesariensis TaxID=207954 RepID=A0A7U8GQE0_NEPCE|nr:preprotein translocase subunit SecA [Neptuniibacter caesariensis]EAR60222.1 SecA DEAD domain protein/helicase, putative [Oceanospirillum sp. MED92] [Neptuniibacter caesariensis]
MYKRPQRLPQSVLERPQLNLHKQGRMERWSHRLAAFLSRPFRSSLSSYKRFLRPIHRESIRLESLTEAEIDSYIAELRSELFKQGITNRLLVRSFALVREVAGRTLGMKHFDSQLLGGLAMFHGNIAEMHTGEGKTLTATLSAATAAFAGVPVHVVTVNDYLTARDAEEMAPVYERLGLSVGVIVHGLSPQERREIYAKDVVYCTNKELVFDYLKDSIVLEDKQHKLHLHAERLKGNQQILEGLMLRGLHFAIVDEADSVLLDEARTPLIISGPEIEQEEQREVYQQAMDIAQELEAETHYLVNQRERRIEYTEDGEARVLQLTDGLGPFWVGRVRCLELVFQALTALHLFIRDKHYLIKDDKVMIVDEHTGRVMEDRTWERGLHQLIEIKERCELSNPRETLARISFQNFFRFYHHLGGMTGTAKEVMPELWQVYGLPVVNIPTNKPSRRKKLGVSISPTEHEKWQKVAEGVRHLHSQGRPVLVGTHSVAASEHLSERLLKLGIEHQLLNAKQDQSEADIVARAGEPGCVTIATNMAGRGTDIKLSVDVEASGGLHVILTELHEASRIDRQLEGRCARQGDQGSFEVILSLEDTILSEAFSDLLKRFFAWPVPSALRTRLLSILMRRAQKQLEADHARMRAELLKQDERQREILSFTSSKI